MDEQDPPELLESVVVGPPGVCAGGGDPELGLAQLPLELLVQLLRVSLRRVNAAMTFEVELASPDGRIRIGMASVPVEVRGCLHRHSWGSLEVLQQPRSIDHVL